MQRRRKRNCTKTKGLIGYDDKYLESHEISNNHLYSSGYILTFFIDSRERLICDAKVPSKKDCYEKE